MLYIFIKHMIFTHYDQETLKTEGLTTLHSIETGLVAFPGTIIHFKFEFTAKA